MMAVCIAALSACATHTPVHTPMREGSAWTTGVEALAREVWLPAQLSAASYSRDAPYPFDQHVRNLQPSRLDPSGMAFRVDLVATGDGNETLVVAFRGSEAGSLRDIREDWVWGNLLGGQNDNALRAFDAVRARWGHDARGRPRHVVVTGHSLGGALATHISLNRPDVTSHVFNSSPRFWNMQDHANRRTSTVEYGEILKLLRLPFPEPTQLYTSLNCVFGRAPVRDHSIDQLALCLTDIAAKSGDARASASLRLLGEAANGAVPRHGRVAPQVRTTRPVNPK